MDAASLLSELVRIASEGAPPAPPALPPGQTGGNGGNGMEARVAKLESDLDHVKKAVDRLAEVPVKLAVLEERVSHLPTKAWMGGWLAGALALLTALITFSDKLHSMLK